MYSDGLYLETKRCASTFGAKIVGFRPMKRPENDVACTKVGPQEGQQQCVFTFGMSNLMFGMSNFL